MPPHILVTRVGCQTELKIQEESPLARHWPNLVCGESSYGTVMESMEK